MKRVADVEYDWAMFNIEAFDEDARVGTVQTYRGAIATPTILISTRRGGSLNLTSDILDSLPPEAKALHINAIQLISAPGVDILKNAPGGGRNFLALSENNFFVITGRDPGIYDYQGALRASTDLAASVALPSGSLLVTPSDYMKLINALQPNIFATLVDEIPCTSKKARAESSANRTALWAEQCLAQSPPHSLPLLAIQGAQYPDLRQKSADSALRISNNKCGYYIAGLGTGESRAQQRQLLEAAVHRLPKDTVKMVSTLNTIEDMLYAIGIGADLFDSSLIEYLTEQGHALSFPVQLDQLLLPPSMPSMHVDMGCGEDATKLNLWSEIFKKDKTPILCGCECIACSRHSRAYLHHLLVTHEMSAGILLEAHNTAHMLRLFKEVRKAISSGRLTEYTKAFLNRREKYMMRMY